MSFRRFVSISSTIIIGVIAGWVSYRHLRALALDAGQPAELALVLPATVDCLGLTAVLALNDGRSRKGSAYLSFTVAVTVSVLANVASAPPTLLGRAVAAWAPVCLMLAIELVHRSGRQAPSASTVTAPEPQATQGQDLAAQVEQFLADQAQSVDQDAATASADTAQNTPAKRTSPRRGKKVPTREKIRRLRDQYPGIGATDLARLVGVSPATIHRHLAALRTEANAEPVGA